MLVWRNVLEERYLCQVVRNDESNGQLQIYDREGKNLHNEHVELSHNSLFQPDEFDIQMWEWKCHAVIDTIVEEE